MRYFIKLWHWDLGLPVMQIFNPLLGIVQQDDKKNVKENYIIQQYDKTEC
jgi:hypothetical protein